MSSSAMRWICSALAFTLCLARLLNAAENAFSNSSERAERTTSAPSTPAVESHTLTVTLSGTGTGAVVSDPPGIRCGSACTATFGAGTQVTLKAIPGPGSYLSDWDGPCSGAGGCAIALNADTSVSVSLNPWPFKHIIFMAQENRSLDHYFGAMRAYWKDNGYPDQSFDGLPQFNPTEGIPPLYGPPPTNPGCDPDPTMTPQLPFPNCAVDSNSPVFTSFHLLTQCIENPDPSWTPSHYDMSWLDPLIDPRLSPPMDGFVSATAHFSRLQKNQEGENGHYYDIAGLRAMSYYDGTDMNYYYFMATMFGTSDRFFSPVMTMTEPNRDYMIAATSQGEVHPIGSGPNDKELTARTIFQALQEAGISWKIYVNPADTACKPPYETSCLVNHTYLKDFQWGRDNLNYPLNLGTIGYDGTCGSSPCDFENDLANGTLPQVAQIEPASSASLDEHGSDSDKFPVAVQQGARYVSNIINPLMKSSSWPDSVFIFTYDESGGLYDHIPPQPTVSPDGILPLDLKLRDVCYHQTGPSCDFTFTGYRIPFIVISPYSKKNYVSHTVADSTTILRFIEARFGLPPLNARDAVQPDMREFFDFNNPPWMTPPNPPLQHTSDPCYLDKLP